MTVKVTNQMIVYKFRRISKDCNRTDYPPFRRYKINRHRGEVKLKEV
jgi:hypothetical protein